MKINKSSPSQTLFVILPCLNDSHSAVEIVNEINSLSNIPVKSFILDDSLGQEEFPKLPKGCQRVAPTSQLGQQGLIVWFLRRGLRNYSEIKDSDLILVLDSDGEDNPLDLKEMQGIIQNGNVDSVIAQRGKRHVKKFFSTGYFAFQTLCLVLAGVWVNSGNFSLSRAGWLKNNIWNEPFSSNFGAGLIVAPGNKVKIMCNRMPRRRGQSRMNKSGLINHGLNILVSFVTLIAARILITTLLWGLLGFMLGTYVIVTKILGYYTPGWTTIVLFSLLQVFILLVTSLLIVLNLSKTSNVLTQKDLDFRVIR